jgi:hypothetical protein
VDLDAGGYHAPIDFKPLTQDNAVTSALDLVLQQAIKIVANDSAARDAATEPSGSLAASAVSSWSVLIGGTANQTLGGWLHRVSPASQPIPISTTDVGFGESAQPKQMATRSYGIWVAPFTATPANLFAEAEGGTLGTGWTSTADANASAGNTAKCASGTASGNAALWGTAWVPPAGKYRMRVRVRLASVASGTSQMQIGLWNSTDSVFVASVTLAPNAALLTGSIVYIWIDVTGLVTPTATKNMRFRAVTTATTTTDWFFDQAALVPDQSAALGVGAFPGDIGVQFIGRRPQTLEVG